MNDYLVPREIAEALGLVKIRKSTQQGLFLLSESDLLAYGLQKAVDEGAIVLYSAGVRVEPETEIDGGSGETPFTLRSGYLHSGETPPDSGSVEEGGDTPPEEIGTGDDPREEETQTAGDPTDSDTSGDQEETPAAEEEGNDSDEPENNEEESV